MRGFWSLGVSGISASPLVGSLAVRFRPDQRPKRDQRALLRRRRSKASIQPLPRQQEWYCPPNRGPRFWCTECEECLQRSIEIGAGPCAVGSLVFGNNGREPGRNVRPQTGHG